MIARGILRLRDDGTGHIIMGVKAAQLAAGDYILRLDLPDAPDLFGSSFAIGDLHRLADVVMPGATADAILTSGWRLKVSDAPKLVNRWGAFMRLPPLDLEDDEPVRGQSDGGDV